MQNSFLGLRYYRSIRIQSGNQICHNNNKKIKSKFLTLSMSRILKSKYRVSWIWYLMAQMLLTLVTRISMVAAHLKQVVLVMSVLRKRVKHGSVEVHFCHLINVQITQPNWQPVFCCQKNYKVDKPYQTGLILLQYTGTRILLYNTSTKKLKLRAVSWKLRKLEI